MRAFFATRTADKFSAYMMPHIKPHMHILDLGCGPGSITCDLAALVPEGSMTGLDVSPESIANASRLADERGLTNARFLVGDVANLHSVFGGGDKFDVIHANYVLMHVAHPISVLRSARSLLKSGGFIAIRDSARVTTFPEIPGMMAQRAAFETISRKRGAQMEGGKENHVWMHEAGFPWEKIEFGADASQTAGKAKAGLVMGAKVTMKQAALEEGLLQEGADAEMEVNRWREGWEEWATLPEARFVTHDGWVIGWL